MSVGSIVGAVVGGIVGFFVGGPLGAVYGASIGFGIGTIIDPITPDVPAPGRPQVGKLNITTADEGLPIADVLGTTKLLGNLIWYANNRTRYVEQQQQEQGKGGFGGMAAQALDATGQNAPGYHYYLTFATGLCTGPVDTLYTVYKGDQCVWEGELNRPESGGEETVTLPDIGTMTFFFGTTDQVAPTAMTNLLADPTLFTNYRRLSYAFFNDIYLGQYNRLPIFKFVFKKSPVLSFNSNKQIETYYYNPAHAIWYVLSQMIGLGEQFLNVSSFDNSATKLFLEDRGNNVTFDRQAQALTYLETILQHIDGVLRWGIDGRLHLKLMRSDEPTENMLVMNEDLMLDDFNFQRKSWLDTQNEIKVQYPLLVVGDCELCLLEETGTPELALISQNGTIGSYEIEEGCPPFFVYFRLSSSEFGDWIFNKTVSGREFNALGPHVGCGFTQIDREIKVVDTYGRDSNFIPITILPVSPLEWDGDKNVDNNDGSVEISWSGGSPPFTLQSNNPFVTFDTQFYSTFLETGLQMVTVYFTAQACGGVDILIQDQCNQGVIGNIFIATGFRWKGEDSDLDIGPSDTAVVVWEQGIGPYTVELVGQFEDIWLDEAMTKTKETLFLGEGITLYSGPDACGDVEVQVTDSCEVTVFGQVSGPGTCYWLLYIWLYTGSGVDGSSVVMLWDPNTNAKAIYPKNSSGDLGDNPGDWAEFAYVRVNPSNNLETTNIDYIHPYGKNGYGGIGGAAALYGKDPDEVMVAPIATSICTEGSTHTCSFWGVLIESLTDLCDATFIDQSPPDDNYYSESDTTEFGFMSANFNAHFYTGQDPYQDTAHLLKIRDQRSVQQTVGEDEFDDVFQNWDYDIDGEIIAPLLGTTKKFNFSGEFNRSKADRAANWNEGGNYISGSAKVPYIQEWANNGYCHGMYTEVREQVAGVFLNTIGVYSMDKWYPYPNQYLTLHHYATAGEGKVPGLDIDTVDVTTMFGRNTGLEAALEELMQFWYDYNGYDTVDIESSDLFDNKMWPEVRMYWLKEIQFPTTTTTTV